LLEDILLKVALNTITLTPYFSIVGIQRIVILCFSFNAM